MFSVAQTMNVLVVIHYLSCMFEVLLVMQMGWKWQGQVLIRNMQGEMKRASGRQKHKMTVRYEDRGKGKETMKLYTKRRKRLYQSK